MLFRIKSSGPQEDCAGSEETSNGDSEAHSEANPGRDSECLEGTSERSYSNQVGQGRPLKDRGHVTLELRTGSDDITSSMCGFISSHLSLFKCTFL